MPEPGPHPRQRVAPYLEALRSFAARDPRRAMVPGHKGGLAADGGLRAALGDGALALDVPTLIEGIDVRRRRAGAPLRGRAAAGGRRVGRAADVVSHQRRLAGQPGGLPGHRAARRARRRAAHRPRQHDRRHRPRGVASRLRRARDRRRARRRALRAALRAGRGPRRAPRARRRRSSSRRRTSVPWPTSAASRSSPTLTACRWWSTRRGARTWPSVPRCPSTRWRRAPTSSSRARTSTPAASPSRRCCTSARAATSTRTPSTVRCGSSPPRARAACCSLRWTRPAATRRCTAPTCSPGRSSSSPRCAPASGPIRGLEVLDERLVGSFGVAAIDPLRVCMDVRGTGPQRPPDRAPDAP